MNCPHCHQKLHAVGSQVECHNPDCPLEKQTLDREQMLTLTRADIDGYARCKAMYAARKIKLSGSQC